jgi:hypothetical protein
MPYQGVSVSTDGQQHVPSAIGPMSRSLSSLSTVTKVVIDTKLWELDAQLPPMPWRKDVYEEFSGRPLVIGIMPDDGVVKVHPPIERVFNETVAKLQEDGHEIVQWDTSLNAHCVGILASQDQKSELHDCDLTFSGCVLHRRRRRGHTSSCDRRWRAIPPACSIINRSRSCDIRLRILAAQQEEGGGTASIPQHVKQDAISVRETSRCTPRANHAAHCTATPRLSMGWLHEAVQCPRLHRALVSRRSSIQGSGRPCLQRLHASK